MVVLEWVIFTLEMLFKSFQLILCIGIVSSSSPPQTGTMTGRRQATVLRCAAVVGGGIGMQDAALPI